MSSLPTNAVASLSLGPDGSSSTSSTMNTTASQQQASVTTTLSKPVVVEVLVSNNKGTMIQANQFWLKQPKANAELFALTYGVLMSISI